MQFTCLQENLEKGLTTVSKAVSARSPLPILANVLIVTEDGRLKLTASNTETSITCYVGASVDADGSITLPAKILGEFVSHLSPTNIDFKLDGAIMHVKAGKTKSKFNGVASSSYPELPEITGSSSVITLDPQVFSDALSHVAFSAALDDTRPILSGILLDYKKGVLTVVSADGFRLSEKVLKVESDLDSFSVVIPAKTLIEVGRIFSKAGEPIKFVISESNNMALFESDEVTVSTRILEGSFPDYKKLIPSDTVLSAEFGVEELLEAVKLTNVFAKNKEGSHSPITVLFSPEGHLKVTSISQETGENHSEIEAEVTGDELSVVFNSRFLLDLLNNIKSDRLVFSTNGELTPGIVRAAGDSDFVHLIMPIRNQD
jgi:DNA polymerase III subunit beta